MVGKRNINGEVSKWNKNQDPSRNRNHGASDADDANHSRRPRDLEQGRNSSSYYGKNITGRPRPRIFKFQDAARTALEDARRTELKTTLLTGIDREGLEKFRKSKDELKEIKNKKLRAFYEMQNQRLNDWLEVDAVVMAIADDVLESMNPDPDRDGIMERTGGIHDVAGNIGELLPEEEKARRKKASRKAKWAININIFANILLLIAKIGAVATTGSLSVLASLVDSALDLLCTIIVWSTTRLVLWRLSALRKRFPVGKRRLEPIGILVFSIIMVISFLQILQESVERIWKHADIEILSWAAIGSLIGTVVIKGAIGIGCYPIKTTQVQALVQDCKTDVIFNTLSLLFPLIGYHANVWWLDPVGAALLSLFIIYDWGHTCFENVTRLSGEAADDHTLKKLIYLAYRFAPVVKGFKNITAYHAGDGVWVEFDVLLDEKTPLNRSHDIAETLQYCAEGLTEVDRAFVSTDYAASGPLGHSEDSEWNH